MDNDLRSDIEGILGVHSTLDPGKYLGLLAVVGSNKKRAFRAIKYHLLERIGSWYNKSLSQGGKVMFIKSILQALPNYTVLFITS